MSTFADLHIHTFYSDSTSSPEEVIEQAKKAELGCIAITDHDTVDGIAPTIECAKKYDIEVIAGIELSTELNGRDIHMLGYCFDYTNPELRKTLDLRQDSRIGRMARMIKNLEDLGLGGITLEDVSALVQSKALGRPHLAQIMVEKGYVRNIKEAFDRYLADDKPACVPHSRQTPKEGIDLIHQYGGIAVLAHPMATKVDELIPQIVRDGLDGIEAYYPHTSKAIFDFYCGIAKKHNLILTGGSDAHGDAKKHTYVGKIKVPYELVEGMKSACTK